MFEWHCKHQKFCHVYSYGGSSSKISTKSTLINVVANLFRSPPVVQSKQTTATQARLRPSPPSVPCAAHRVSYDVQWPQAQQQSITEMSYRSLEAQTVHTCSFRVSNNISICTLSSFTFSSSASRFLYSSCNFRRC